MSNKMKTVRDILESVDVLNPERCSERIGEALGVLRSMEAEAGEAVAWMRKWAYDNDNGSVGCRPHGWKLNAITRTKLLPTDVPLYAHPKAQEEEVELTEAEIGSVAELMAPSLAHIHPDELRAHRDGIERGIRHLASKYRLIPR